jgi:probable HAF family extracellular repeat protein
MNTCAIRSALISALGVALALASVTAGAGPIYTLTDLGTLGGTRSVGGDLNASGQVTGWAYTADGHSHAFLWDGTTMQDLGTLPGGLISDGLAVNASGQVTGYATTMGSSEVHAFLWDGTTLQDLGTLGGGYSWGLTINDAGQVTGYSGIGAYDHAFLWDGTTMLDLMALIAPDDPLQPFVTLSFAVDINDLGQILANGFDSRTGELHAYLVSPLMSVPEPGTFALLGLGLAGLGVARRRRAASARSRWPATSSRATAVSRRHVAAIGVA